MSKIDAPIRIIAVKDYLAGGTLDEKAAIFRVHRNTLWRWVKWYRQGGSENLLSPGSYPWNRIRKGAENKIVLLKESMPSLTIRKAQKIMERQGMKISIKGIWGVWKRNGLGGFVKERFSTSYRDYLTSSVTSLLVNKLAELVAKKENKAAAKIINALTVFPYVEILKKIPEQQLSLARQIDQLGGLFGKIPLSLYRNKARILREKSMSRKMHYSALRAGIQEGYALIWLGYPKELLILSGILKRKAKGLRDPGLRFAVSLFEGHALGSFLRIPEALKCAGKCRMIISRLRQPYLLMNELAGLYSVLGYFRKAIHWTMMAFKGITESHQEQLCYSLAGFLATSGDYRAALKMLKKGGQNQSDYQSRTNLIKGFVHLNKGNFQEASALATKTLQQLKKEEIGRFFHLTTFILACCHAAAGEKQEATTILKKYNPLLKKHRLEKEYYLRRILLGDGRLPKGALFVPNLRLAALFYRANLTKKAKDYYRALHYGQRQKLFGLFSRLALFFPDPVIRLLKKGRKPGLPTTFLQMPVFQIDPPVYNLKFLGRIQILKGEKLLYHLRFSPKDAAFLIHLSVYKHRRLLLNDLYRNFWSRSKRPSRNLSHLLVRIKKRLSLPSYLLRIRGDFLVWNFYLVTDYGYFVEKLSQAQALARAGEWDFAKRKYQEVFRLFRGEPFRKIYDNWSLDLRHKILTELENAASEFVRLCHEHKDDFDAKMVLAKANKILAKFIP